MKTILFLHNNYPAQFGAIAHHLAKGGARVIFGTAREDAASEPGVTVAHYKLHREVQKGIHPYAAEFEKAVLTGQAVARMAFALKHEGISPDVVMVHSGWGPGFYVKDVWPQTKLIGYFEWYYHPNGPDATFLNGGVTSDDSLLLSRTRNAAILMDLAHCDWGISPTAWQASQIPPVFRSKLSVQHDGVDVNYYAPAEDARLHLPGLDLSDAQEIITYVARGMEPYRGFPQFMEAVAKVLKARPEAHAVIVGADRVAYGARPKNEKSYKEKALEELDLDLERVHFTGLLPRDQYLCVLQASSVHIYLTVPFVLSWSMMEAMAAGCLLIASDTAPVREVATHGETALLVDFFDTDALADQIVECLAAPKRFKDLRATARRKIVDEYAASRLVPQKALLMDAVVDGLMR